MRPRWNRHDRHDRRLAGKSFRERNPVAIGISTVLALCLLTVTAAAAAVLSLGTGLTGYTMSGVFAETGDTRPGTPVFMAGVRLGAVSSVRPDFTRSQVIITWRVESSVKVGGQASAAIQMLTPIGGRMLNLSGPVVRPFMNDLPERQRRIPLERTKVPYNVNALLTGGTRAAQSVDTNAINRLLAQVSGVARRDRGKLGGIFANLSALTETVRQSDAQLTSLLESGRRLTSLAQGKDRELTELVQASQMFLTELTGRRNQLKSLLSTSGTTVGDLAKVTERNQTGIDSLLRNVHAIAGDLRTAVPDVNHVAALLGPVTGQISTWGGNGPWIELIVRGALGFTPEGLAKIFKLLSLLERPQRP